MSYTKYESVNTLSDSIITNDRGDATVISSFILSTEKNDAPKSSLSRNDLFEWDYDDL